MTRPTVKKIAIACITFTAMTACGSSTAIQSRMTAADEALSNGDYTVARDICDRLIDDTASMTADEFGRLAICYMSIADKTDEQTIVTTAVECYTGAYRRNPEAATNFFRSQPVENDRYIMILSTIAGASGIDPSDLTDHDILHSADSIAGTTQKNEN